VDIHPGRLNQTTEFGPSGVDRRPVHAVDRQICDD